MMAGMADADGVLAAIDSCLDDYEVSDDAMRWAPAAPDPTPLVQPVSPFSVQPAVAAFSAFANALQSAAEEAMQGFGKAFTPVVTGMQNAFHKHAHRGDRSHYRRCAICNPRGFPQGMSINRAEYTRRRRRRNRR